MNKIYIGNYNINKAYLGGDLTIKIFLGDNLVYPIEDAVAITFYDESGNTATINCDDLSQSGRISYSDAESFQGTSYTSAVVGDCVTIIGGGSMPYQLTSLTLSDSVTELEENGSIPQNCVTLVCGTGLTTVGGYCMEFRTSLQSVTFNGSTPPTFNTNWEEESNKTFTIYVPCNSIEAYRTALSGKTANLNDRLQCIPTPSYESKYLTIESQANNNQISFSNNIQYSVDNGSTWTTLATGNTVSLNSGDTAMFKASGITPTGADGIGHFSSTDSYKVYGNVMSLVYGDNFSGQTTMSDYQFIRLFCKDVILQNPGLTDASNLVLPATTLTDFCYYRMFENCVNLTAAPELPATTLTQGCYAEMFQGCSSLLAAPSLPATTLANECYDDMFFGCSSLTAAPQLPASVMTNQCYTGMFANCSGLTSAPALSATTLANQCYKAMFENCTSLTTAPALPATTMAASAYTDMFFGCSSLTSAPALPATTLADWCYRGMFDGCTSLTSAPALPATTLATACYYDMFFGCTGLTTAPDLSASTLVDRCYRDMFSGCTGLNYIKCLATDISAEYCTTNWVSGVASTGTFVKSSSMSSWTTGVDGIPTGWVVENEGNLPYSGQYLTIESTSNNNTIYWRSAYSNAFITISASTDNGTTWTEYTSSYNNGTTIATLNSGDTIIFRGENAQYNSRGIFGSTSSFIVYGNIMSLLYGDNFSEQTTLTSGGTFNSLFSSCSGLTSAENLILPATTLADWCYSYMFNGCTSLTTVPELPATTLADYCYNNMFYNCTSLTTAPELPATTLAQSCYNRMFGNCSSLTTAPVLSATTLADWCYMEMFQGCTNLNSITCLATDISARNCTAGWVDGVAASGSFFVPSGNPASWECGVDGVPSDWTIEDTNGDTYECTGGGGEPSTDVPLDNCFAVKVNGEWHKSNKKVRNFDDIEMALSDLGLDIYDVEELAIGNRTHNINLNGDRCNSCTGLTLAQNVTNISDIYDFPAMQWVNVMANYLEYRGFSGLFSYMNCCPIYVPEDYLSDFQDYWGNETTDDCDGSVADRLVAWTPYIDPNNPGA